MLSVLFHILNICYCGWALLSQQFLKESPERLVKNTDYWAPPPDFDSSLMWGLRISISVTSQVILILCIWVPCFEDHCSILNKLHLASETVHIPLFSIKAPDQSFLLLIWIQMPVSRQKRTKNSSIPYHRCDKQLYYKIGKWVFNKMTAINITIIIENILSTHELLF